MRISALLRPPRRATAGKIADCRQATARPWLGYARRGPLPCQGGLNGGPAAALRAWAGKMRNAERERQRRMQNGKEQRPAFSAPMPGCRDAWA